MYLHSIRDLYGNLGFMPETTETTIPDEEEKKSYQIEPAASDVAPGQKQSIWIAIAALVLLFILLGA